MIICVLLICILGAMLQLARILFLPKRSYKGMLSKAAAAAMFWFCNLTYQDCTHTFSSQYYFPSKRRARWLAPFTLELSSSTSSCRPSMALFCLHSSMYIQHHSAGCTSTEQKKKSWWNVLLYTSIWKDCCNSIKGFLYSYFLLVSKGKLGT